VIAGRLDELLQAEAFERIGIELSKADNVALDSSDVGIVEAVVSPRSTLAGRTLRDVSFRDRYGLTALALWREGRPIRTHLASIPLQVGDGLLIQGHAKALQVLKDEPDFIVLDEEIPGAAREDRRIHALLAVGVMIVLTLTGVHIAVAAGIAVGFMILTDVLVAEEAYRAVDLRSIVLMGAMLSLAVALEKTGAAATLADQILAVAGTSPRAALAILLAMGVVLANLVPTVTQAALMTPLAIKVAASLGTSVVPFAMAIMAANGLAILTPFGNPVMLLVMSPGGYRVRDYMKSGVPLVVILLIVLLLVIPLAYPF
ncbi:MAG: SLC13 family permease, partial [bacterium]